MVKSECIDLTVDEIPFPRRTHVWNAEQRIVLRILKDGYHVEWAELVPLFNASVLPAHGCGLSQAILYAQYNHIVKPSSRISKENRRASFPYSQADEEFVRHSLETTASKLGIKLVRRELERPVDEDEAVCLPYENTDRRSSSHANSSALNCSNTDLSPCSVGNSDTTLPEPRTRCSVRTPRTPTRSFPQTTEIGLMTPPDSGSASLRIHPSITSPHSTPIRAGSRTSSHVPLKATTRRPTKVKSVEFPVQELPILGFRGFSSQSQGYNGPDRFLAGLFAQPNAARISACPVPDSDAFRIPANLHVGWNKTQSPFISITSSPIRAMMKSRGPLFGRSLAVIDMHRIRETGSIFTASTLHLKPKKDDGSPVIYHSGGEYLVWGHIPGYAILSSMSPYVSISCPSTKCF